MVEIAGLFQLESHGPDTYVGVGPRYPWGGLYGGQIVAQALRAAAATVDDDLDVHSLRAYFIRRGDHSEPIRFEVDRIRNGRSFATRRVVARQAIGAILNLEASFQRPEPSADVQCVACPVGLPQPDELEESSWSEAFQRRSIPMVGSGGHVAAALASSGILGGGPAGGGLTAAWMRVNGELGDDELVHRCWLAFLSDDLPTDAVREVYGGTDPGSEDGDVYGASLDHSLWFHRPFRADEWHLHIFAADGYVGGRGLAFGHVFRADGVLAASVAQEALMRRSRIAPSPESA